MWPLTPGHTAAAPTSWSLQRAVVADTPSYPGELVRVVIPAFGDLFWGPITWTPRIDALGRVVMPTTGTPAIVALDERRQALCVIAWGDGTEVGTGPDLADLAARVAALEDANA